ncbi:MAG: hypothetical protein ACYDED_13005 [Ferrimicrobium sp.]
MTKLKADTAPHQARLTAGLVGLIYLLYLVVRVSVAAKGRISALALIGTTFGNRARVPSYLAMTHGTGYDGQFFLRLALDPFRLTNGLFGISFDTPFRAQRIGYPFLAWLLSAGNGRLVPISLVVVNLLAVVAIAYFGTIFARGSAQPWITGALLACYFGYLMSVGRDLAEPTAAALVLAGLVAFQSERPLLAALAFAFAALTLETELIVPIAIGIVWLARLVQRRPTRINPILFLLPGLTAAGWQIIITLAQGKFAAATDLSGNIGVPGFTVIEGIVSHLHQLNTTNLLWFGQLAVVAVAVIAAAVSLKHTTAPSYLIVAWALMLVLTLSLSGEVWNNSSYFRATDLLWLTSILIWTLARPRHWWYASVGFIAFGVSAIPMLRFL